MDELLNNFLSSSSWSDSDVSKRSSWVGNGPAETNGLLPKTRGVYKRDEKSSSISLIPSSHIMESSVQQGPSSLLAVGNSNHRLDESQLQQKSPDHESKPSLNGVMNGNSNAGYMGLRLNTTTSTPSALNLSSPKLLPVADGSAKSPRALPESGSVGSNDSEPSGFQQSRRESHYLPSIPQLWSPPSYGCLASLSPVIEQDKLHGFGLQEEYVDSDANVLGNRYLEDDKTLQLENMPASISVNGQEEMYSHSLPSFTAGPQMTLTRSSGLLLHPQMPQLGEGNPNKHYINHTPVSQLQSASTTAVGGCNGAAKPRVRARRGQATDPHSIAERLRREKIAERMKNLQELVPNTNKTDKASMLDEIIEYVKFLQLQVKVLSMSRLGATGAVVPLITDGQSEGSGGLLLMPPAGQGADLSESLDNIAFEQEVVKLMESNVTMAMQFLQSKGLCLMPIALAAAISGGNASSGLIYSENKKPSFTSGLILHNGSTDVGTQQMSSDGEIVSHNNIVITTNGCGEAAVKQESRALNGIQEKSNPKA